jgi:hypothetical protein
MERGSIHVSQSSQQIWQLSSSFFWIFLRNYRDQETAEGRNRLEHSAKKTVGR